MIRKQEVYNDKFLIEIGIKTLQSVEICVKKVRKKIELSQIKSQ